MASSTNFDIVILAGILKRRDEDKSRIAWKREKEIQNLERWSIREKTDRDRIKKRKMKRKQQSTRLWHQYEKIISTEEEISEAQSEKQSIKFERKFVSRDRIKMK